MIFGGSATINIALSLPKIEFYILKCVWLKINLLNELNRRCSYYTFYQLIIMSSYTKSIATISIEFFCDTNVGNNICKDLLSVTKKPLNISYLFYTNSYIILPQRQTDNHSIFSKSVVRCTLYIFYKYLL